MLTGLMPSIYSITAKYSLSRVLIERCERGWKLNESQTGERQSVVIQRQMAAMLHITLGNGVSDRTCGTKN